MELKNIILEGGFTKDYIKDVSGGRLNLYEDIFIGVKHRHNWICSCGNIIKNRTWDNIRRRHTLKCDECQYNELEQKYKYEVEKDGKYKYIRSYRRHDVLPNGKAVMNKVFLEMMHIYCGEYQIIESCDFINRSKKCRNCCGSYENSFAHYIEVELGLKLEDVWDFENNAVNPYHISRGMDKTNGVVWIKCSHTDYHGSYETSCDSYVRSSIYTTKGCPYCASKKVHPRDSFAQYHIDNTDKDFLEKYWDWDKNTLNPWELSISNDKKIWIKCQSEEINNLNGLTKKDYHPSYYAHSSNFTKGHRCPYCTGMKTHNYDSFGYYNLQKSQSWSPSNNVSPFKVANKTRSKFKFICDTCGDEFIRSISDIYRSVGVSCKKCTKYKGEFKILKFLQENNVNHIHDEPCFRDLLSDKGNPLRPDFILPEHKIWIEYDGEFHYEVQYDKGKFITTKKHDKRKNKYAKEHGWKMIRIPYWEYDNIEEILNKEIIDSNKLI